MLDSALSNIALNINSFSIISPFVSLNFILTLFPTTGLLPSSFIISLSNAISFSSLGNLPSDIFD